MFGSDMPELASPVLFLLVFLALITAIFFPKRNDSSAVYFPLGFWRKRIHFRERKLVLVPLLIICMAVVLAAAAAGLKMRSVAVVSGELAVQNRSRLLIVFDVSGSMNYKYERSRQAYQDILSADLPVALGMLVFADEPYILRDFTINQQEFMQGLVDDKTVISRGLSAATEIPAALHLAHSFLNQQQPPSLTRGVIVISDFEAYGRGNVAALSDTAEEIRALNQEGIAVFGLVVELNDKIAQERIDYLYSNTGGGNADNLFVSSRDEQGKTAIFQQIAKLASQSSPAIARDVHASYYVTRTLFVLVAIGLLLAIVTLSETRFRKIP